MLFWACSSLTDSLNVFSAIILADFRARWTAGGVGIEDAVEKLEALLASSKLQYFVSDLLAAMGETTLTCTETSPADIRHDAVLGY
jgi:hypothetical protein